MILIIASEQDPAGINIANNILEHHDFEQIGDRTYEYSKKEATMVIIEERTIFSDFIERRYEEVEALFFVTRHSSVKAISTLSTHSPGNFHDAMHGGAEGKLCPSNPVAQKLALQSMIKQRDETEIEYEVSLEATHHGPLTSVPTTFFEVGSTLEQWKDVKAGEIVANATMEALSYKETECPIAVGVGGGHYPEKLSKVVDKTQWAIGHIIPKYAFPIDDGLIKATFEKNGGDTAIFDWKGTPQRSTYSELFLSLGYKTLKTKDLTFSLQ